MNRAVLSPIFAGQLGLATVEQAESAGVSRRQLSHLVSTRELATPHRGVVRHRAFPITAAQQQLAAVLAAGPGSAVSHRSAAVAIGLRNVQSQVIEVSRPISTILRLEGVFVHRLPDLADEDVTVCQGIPTTTPARTLVDLGSVTSTRFVTSAIEQWTIGGLVTVAQIEEVVERVARRGRDGVGVIRAALTEHVRGAELADSVPEGRISAICQRYRIPNPVLHHLVTVASGTTYELDWAYPAQRIALEIDGFGVHLRSRQAFADDRIRHNELELDGWKVLRWAAATVSFRPDVVARQITQALLACAPDPARDERQRV